jgi:multimeric flavodoxin WrbA
MASTIRKGQAPPTLSRDAFGARFRQSFADPEFATERDALQRLEVIAWRAYDGSRKQPFTHSAGPGYADPDYQLSDEWRETRGRIERAQAQQADAQSPSRVLLVCGSTRNDGTCPGEMSKSFRLTELARQTLQECGLQTDVLDLSLLASDYQRRIHPCKACVSTAMPLCHWPCSCYPNHALGQTGDWMAEIYERWAAAHGVLLVTPVNWYGPSSSLKLMIDRLVCADGGNPDPTSTSGKNAQKAKALELQGWHYPKHLAGRVYGLVVHGDVAGVDGVRHALSDWLDWMGLIDAGAVSQLDRYLGYYEPYATSHDALDRDEALQEEVRNAARALAAGVAALRAGRLGSQALPARRPRPK